MSGLDESTLEAEIARLEAEKAQLAATVEKVVAECNEATNELMHARAVMRELIALIAGVKLEA
jgi:hypothetical protein